MDTPNFNSFARDVNIWIIVLPLLTMTLKLNSWNIKKSFICLYSDEDGGKDGERGLDESKEEKSLETAVGMRKKSGEFKEKKG